MEKQQGWDCGQDLHDGQKEEGSGSLCWSPSHRESWWGGQGCSTRARKGLRGEALDAKLQWADTGKLKGTLGDSRSMCPNFLSRGISNLKQLQTPSSKYVFPISSRLRKEPLQHRALLMPCMGEQSPSVQQHKGTEWKHVVLPRAAAGTEIWV